MSDPIEEEAVSNAFAIQGMLNTEGWKLLTEQAELTKAVMLEKLLYVKPGSEELFEYQAQARAMNFLLGFPNQVLETAKKAQEAAADAKAQQEANDPNSQG